MGDYHSIKVFLLVFCILEAFAIPSSMVDEIKSRELRPNKVKRVSLPLQSSEENSKNSNHYNGNPTAIKRGSASKNEGLDDGSTNDSEWTSDEQNIYQNVDNDFQSPLYNSETPHDWKSINDYQKGFQYGINKDKLDEALENAVLKSEMYNGPSPMNQYGYMANDKRKRRKRDSRKFNYGSRMTTDNLTPEEVRTLLALYENEYQSYPKRPEDSDEFEQDSDTWLDVPVRPQAGLPNLSDLGPAYTLDQNQPIYEKPRLTGNTNNRFMAATKRNDPTREIKYLTGPTKHDYYTLSQLLNNEREANVPVFHRYIL